MSAKSGGSLATFLMSVPLAAIPLMAIFGIPQFAPVSASPDRADEVEFGDAYPKRDLRDRYRQRSSDVWGEPDDRERTDLLSDAPTFDPFREESATADESATSRGSRHRLSTRNDARRPLAARSAAAEPLDAIDGNARDGRTDEWEHTSDGSYGRVTAATDATEAVEGMAVESARFLERGSPTMEATRRLTWREAARELSDRGIENFRLERGHDVESFLFVCTLIPGDTPSVTMRFEAEAVEPLAAVSNVLDQVDDWLRGRFAAYNGDSAGPGATR